VSDFPTAFEPATPGTWTTIARVAANHESAHALAAFLLDGELQEVRIDDPDTNVVGHVAWRVKQGDGLWKKIAVALAPLILTKRCPDYPPSLQSDDGDEENAARTCHKLTTTEAEYRECVAVIAALLDLPSSKRKLTALSSALLERGALSGEDATKILRDAGP
jgi:hypothetical protein